VANEVFTKVNSLSYFLVHQFFVEFASAILKQINVFELELFKKKLHSNITPFQVLEELLGMGSALCTSSCLNVLLHEFPVAPEKL